MLMLVCYVFSSRGRHTKCALVTGVQTCALPISPEEPAVLAIAAGHVSLRAPCYRLVCPDAEWLEPTAYTTLWKPRVPGTVPRLPPARASPLATRSYPSPHAPTTKRDWFDPRAIPAKVAPPIRIPANPRPHHK